MSSALSSLTWRTVSFNQAKRNPLHHVNHTLLLWQAHDQKQVKERESFLSSYNSAHIPPLRENREGPKSRNLEPGTEAAIPKEFYLLDRSIHPQALISLLSYTTQDRLPRDSTTYSGLGTPIVIIKKILPRLLYKPIRGRQFLYWSSLSPCSLNCILSWQWEKSLIHPLPLTSWFQCTLLLKVSVMFLFIYLIYLQLVCESFCINGIP